ncbi:SGNH/GDSL hydrolase family protein [Pseudoduganella namucuonensis]|uniref:Uncharacterized protein n=1 Tax=Pseudoduganella namucuonensis TaxID=1035707 RepID=A0A1I7LVD4_9BURK|nr:SGNH/GDSL hydrolase family protein [Pseudoduganella namucuonensis]SFV13540.1 hypothetical protein SAMN05216552_103921 [Pseudoduganella namucuonensis]
MRILIIGGSNSLLKDGYVSHLQQSLQGHTEVHVDQASVGATTSLAAIGRLFDTYRAGQYDFILYEYSINDAGHFAPRPRGDQSWQLCLYLLIKAAAQLYPNAVLVPLVFAMERHFSPAQPSPFYDMQIAAFRALGLHAIDIRQWLAALFLGNKPAWLYRDEAHYAAPHATALVGAAIAARLLELARGNGGAPAETLAVTAQRLLASSPHAGMELVYVPAANLAQFAKGPAEPARVGNRLMQLDCLRMHPGASLALSSEMFPLALFLKSDRQHDRLRLTLSGAGIAATVEVGTRHADTATLPFIYSCVPLPLLFSHALVRDFGPTAFEVAVPAPAAPAGPVASFDCFSQAPAPVPEPRLDLVGLLFVVGKKDTADAATR